MILQVAAALHGMVLAKNLAREKVQFIGREQDNREAGYLFLCPRRKLIASAIGLTPSPGSRVLDRLEFGPPCKSSLACSVEAEPNCMSENYG